MKRSVRLPKRMDIQANLELCAKAAEIAVCRQGAAASIPVYEECIRNLG